MGLSNRLLRVFMLISGPCIFYSPASADPFFKEYKNKVGDALSDLSLEKGIRDILLRPEINQVATLDIIQSEVTKIETTKFQHYYRGLEVIGSVAFHHKTDKGSTIRDRIAKFDLDTNPVLSPSDAASIALSYDPESTLRKTPSLKVLPVHEQNNARLIYWVEINGKTLTGNSDVIVDASSGQVLAQLPHYYTLAPYQVYSARKRGIVVHAQQSEGSSRRVKNCILENLQDGTSQTISSTQCRMIYAGTSPISKETCQVIDAKLGFPLDIQAKQCSLVATGTEVMDQIDPSAQRAASHSRKVLSYFSERFGRNSFDNKGSQLDSVIHAGQGLSNAFWMTDLNTMVYGDGDGETTGDFTLSLDVAGHEMTHGIVSHTADFLMMGEAGALNEAFSDFFGKMIENQDQWMLGRDLFFGQSGRRGIRNLKNPGELQSTIVNQEGRTVKRPYPAHQKDAAPTRNSMNCNESNDYCWVHFNATIPGHASYRVYEALGKETSELLYYTSLTQNLSRTDDFKSAAKAILQTCKQLELDPSDCEIVKEIYQGVGVL